MSDELSGLNQFMSVYEAAHLLPYREEESQEMISFSKCINCGLCLNRCPILLGHEGADYPGPRSISTCLSRSVADFWASEDLIYQCTTCMACEEICSQSVPITDMVKMIRHKLVVAAHRRGEQVAPLKERIFEEFLLKPGRLDRLAAIGSRVQGLIFSGLGGGAMKQRLPLGLIDKSRRLPPLAKRTFKRAHAGTARVEHPRLRVGFFVGCMVNYVYPTWGQAVLEVLRRHGVEVVVPRDQACCGAPLTAYGDLEKAKQLAEVNIRAFGDLALDAIVTACGSCGRQLKKEYPRLFTPNEEMQPKAVRFGSLTCDINEFLTQAVELEPTRVTPRQVTYHDPCHLRRGQGIMRAPRQIIQSIEGVEWVEMADPGACCGGAGTFTIEHYPWSAKIRDRKLEDIRATGAQVVATACPACKVQLVEGLALAEMALEVVHPVELLAEGYANQ